MAMKTIAAAKFKEQCLALLDSVDDDGLLITKRGKVVARLLPVRATGAHLIGVLALRTRRSGGFSAPVNA
jgi:prevent-host-death family protein